MTTIALLSNPTRVPNSGYIANKRRLNLDNCWVEGKVGSTWYNLYQVRLQVDAYSFVPVPSELPSVHVDYTIELHAHNRPTEITTFRERVLYYEFPRCFNDYLTIGEIIALKDAYEKALRNSVTAPAMHTMHTSKANTQSPNKFDVLIKQITIVDRFGITELRSFTLHDYKLLAIELHKAGIYYPKWIRRQRKGGLDEWIRRVFNMLIAHGLIKKSAKIIEFPAINRHIRRSPTYHALRTILSLF